MSGSLLIGIALLAQTGAKTPALSFGPAGFKLTAASGTVTIPVPKASASRPAAGGKVQYRRDDAFAVWDARGLTIRHGAKSITTRLSEVPLDKKWRTQEAIEDTRLLVRLNHRQLGADRLVASARFGSNAYFLVQWSEKDSRPWLQALVRADLATETPKAQVLILLRGAFAPSAPAEGALSIVAGKLAIIDQERDRWSILQVDPGTQAVSRKDMGARLEGLWMHSARLGAFVEFTEHGTWLLGRTDLVTRSRRDLVETRGFVRLIDGKEPWIAVVRDDTGLALHNLVSGARLKIDIDDRWVRSGSRVVVYQGGESPTRAVWYEAERWARVAEWRRPGARSN